MHYTTKELRKALEFYKDIIAIHPDTQEAGYSRSQIENIVNATVPKQELFDARVELALAHFEHGDQLDARRDLGPPIESEDEIGNWGENMRSQRRQRTN